MSRLILASSSPRRRELLTQIGLKFEVIASNAEENTKSREPSEMVQELSLLKATDVFAGIPPEEREGTIVIGADTLVSLGGRVMGKPVDERHAQKMLAELQGNTHQVYTGVTLLWQAAGAQEPQRKTFYEKTDVTMFPMSTEEIKSYIATGEPMDKAGAYGIQGKCAAYIRGLSGDYYNVVGLPVGRLYQELKGLERKE